MQRKFVVFDPQMAQILCACAPLAGVHHRFFGTTENTETHGSAKGTHKAFSDIDVMPNPYALWPLRNFFNARLNELPIPYKIDLVLESHIKAPKLQAHIARVGQIFYERKDVP